MHRKTQRKKIQKRSVRALSRVLIPAAALFLLLGCGPEGDAGTVESPQGQVADKPVSQGTAEITDSIAPEVVRGEELLCLVDSEEEAKTIADQYGIELVNFSYGVATFHTEDDPQKVIDMGKEKGYPELSLNGIMEMY